MKRILLPIVAVTLLWAQTATAELTRVADNVYSYVGEKDASPAHSFAANAGIVIGRDGMDDRLQPEEPLSGEEVRTAAQGFLRIIAPRDVSFPVVTVCIGEE